MGLTKQGILWAFSLTPKVDTYWHPVTWLSFMLDHDLYGSNYKLYNFTNLFLHLANTILLFITLHKISKSKWRSALVSFLFALHPLNVESVAWITERTNTLSFLFWILSILIYYCYVNDRKFYWYFQLTMLFSIGLMVKPIICTLPFLLLLLDYWPFERFKKRNELNIRSKNIWYLFQKYIKPNLFIIFEKIPLFILSAVSIIITISTGGEVVSIDRIPISIRIENALVAYASYIYKMFLPYNLTVYYPYPDSIQYWKYTGSGLILISITIVFLWFLRERKYLTVGWLWYLGTLFPVIGLIQAGIHPATADRYSYIPLIGLFICFSWSLFEITENRKKTLAAIILGIIVSIPVITYKQLGYWKNSITIFEHNLEIVGDNPIANNNIGIEYAGLGNKKKAIQHFNRAIKKNQNYTRAHFNLGITFLSINNLEKAEFYFKNALKLMPNDAESYYQLGLVKLEQNNKMDAMELFYEALKIKKDYPDVYFKLGNIYFNQKKYNQAKKKYQNAIIYNLNHAEAYNNLGAVLIKEKNVVKALVYFKKALMINPEYTDARENIKNARLMLNNKSVKEKK